MTTPEVTLLTERMPALGLGTWELTGDACREAVEHALGVGYRHIDTAEMYGNEVEVGRAIKHSDIARSDVWLTTKVQVEGLDKAGVIRAVEGSLERLATSYVDLLLIHWPPRRVPLGPSLEALDEMHQAGRAREIGVSNFNAPLLDEALRVAPIACNQIEYHPYLDQSGTLTYMRQRKLALIAYCPLARGRVMNDEVLRAIAHKHDRSPAEVTLRWLLQQVNVGAVPKAASAEHQRENLGALEFELNDGDMARIFALERGERLIDPDFAPDWGSR